LCGHHRVEDAQRLADLHGAALEAAEHGEELFGVARRRRRRDVSAIRARERTTEAGDRPAAEAQRQGHQLRRPHDPARHRGHDLLPMSTTTSSSWAIVQTLDSPWRDARLT